MYQQTEFEVPVTKMLQSENTCNDRKDVYFIIVFKKILVQIRVLTKSKITNNICPTVCLTAYVPDYDQRIKYMYLRPVVNFCTYQKFNIRRTVNT